MVQSRFYYITRGGMDTVCCWERHGYSVLLGEAWIQCVAGRGMDTVCCWERHIHCVARGGIDTLCC